MENVYYMNQLNKLNVKIQTRQRYLMMCLYFGDDELFIFNI